MQELQSVTDPFSTISYMRFSHLDRYVLHGPYTIYNITSCAESLSLLLSGFGDIDQFILVDYVQSLCS